MDGSMNDDYYTDCVRKLDIEFPMLRKKNKFCLLLTYVIEKKNIFGFKCISAHIISFSGSTVLLNCLTE